MFKDSDFEPIDDCRHLTGAGSTRSFQNDVTLLGRRLGETAQRRRDAGAGTRSAVRDGRAKTNRALSTAVRHRGFPSRPQGAMHALAQRRLAAEALDQVRDELAHIARLMTLGELTASIAHEVNQPLAGVIANASTCQRMLAADPPNIQGALETARRARRDGDRASEVIKRVRALFQKKESVVELVDLNKAASEAIALSFQNLQGRGVTLDSSFGPALPPVRGDQVQLQQVILNLILNAADALEGVHDRPRHVIVKTSRSSAGWVELSVRDTGRGVHPDDLHKIFDAFYTTKAQGMGIGLSVSQSIIHRHGGEIRAARNRGAGSTFAFTVPGAAEAP